MAEHSTCVHTCKFTSEKYPNHWVIDAGTPSNSDELALSKKNC